MTLLSKSFIVWLLSTICYTVSTFALANNDCQSEEVSNLDKSQIILSCERLVDSTPIGNADFITISKTVSNER
ncbi:hypothetical protein [Shewanella sp. NIFS-20-20]|uniref:hypothetical protein n=1 Tax=Shewanella sp. NIFS-20-20 TaxID=2853806 RepID=UPI001C47FEBE|nr:hypothetical protein [Shewanella sp. NIFS-20-20]MBV7314954.1 hypothetical protein [Shewanella sp. NIFS-20-20]